MMSSRYALSKCLFISLVLCFFVTSKSIRLSATQIDGTSFFQYEADQYDFSTETHANGAIGLVWFRQGFKVHGTTIATLDITLPVNGEVNLNSGTIQLDRPLHLGADATIINSGTIRGEGNAFLLDGDLTYPATGTGKTLTVNVADSTETIIDGRGHHFTLAASNTLSVDASTTLTLKNMDFSVFGTLTMGAGSTLRLDNVRLHLPSDLTFSAGALEIFNKVTIDGASVKFNHTSTSAVTINSFSTLVMANGTTFKFDTAANFTFTDATSVLYLEGATFDFAKASTSLNLQKGTLMVDGHSYIKASGSSGGIDLGGSDVSTNRFYIVLKPSAQLECAGGSINYLNDT